MKIAFFTDTYHPVLNGVTVSVQNLAEELRRQGHTAYILAPEVKGYRKREKHVLRLPSIQVISSIPEVRLPLVLPGKVDRDFLPSDIDIIHAHGNGPFSLLGYQIAQARGVPFVMSFHTQFTRYTHYIFNGRIIKPRLVAAGLKFSGNLCDAVISPSEKMRDELLSYGITKPTHVIPNFIPSGTKSLPERGFLRKKLGIPSDHLILLAVGRLAKEKNFPFLIRAFEKTAKKFSGVHLVIVGAGSEKNALTLLARKQKSRRRIHLAGKIVQDKMSSAYNDADIFVFSSTTEVHSMAILEAASHGLPFVVVKDDSYRNLIDDGINGFLTQGNQREFIAKLEELLADRRLRMRFGKKSEMIVKERFDPEKISKRLVALYAALKKSQKPRSGILASRFNRSAWVQLYKRAVAMSGLTQQ